MIQDLIEKYAARVWDKKDLSAIDEFVDPHALIHNPLGDFHGPHGIKKTVEEVFRAFPDYHVKNLSIFQSGDKVAIQWEGKGTHQHEFQGIQPKSKSIVNHGVTIYQVKNGKIIEYWAYYDMQSLMKQMK